MLFGEKINLAGRNLQEAGFKVVLVRKLGRQSRRAVF